MVMGTGNGLKLPLAGEPQVWVSTTSHRSRERLAMLFRIAAEDGPGPEYGAWPHGGRPHGSYYRVPARHAEAIGRIAGARVLRAEPKDLFTRWTWKETGGPEPGNWAVPGRGGEGVVTGP